MEPVNPLDGRIAQILIATCEHIAAGLEQALQLQPGAIGKCALPAVRAFAQRTFGGQQ